MKTDEVPQDRTMYGEHSEVFYAVDEQGEYVLAGSSGWNAVGIANRQAWEEIEADVAEAIEQVRKGRKSPLVIFMAAGMMDAALLASYAGLSRWKVRRHLKPRPFATLAESTLSGYAQLFGVTIETLRNPSLEISAYMPEFDQEKTLPAEDDSQ